MKEDLMHMAEKSAHQRVQIIELEKLLDQAQDEIRQVHNAMQQAVNEANEKITSEADLVHKSLAGREAKYVSGMNDLSQALHDTRDQLKIQILQKSESTQQLNSLILQMNAVEEEEKTLREVCRKLEAENMKLQDELTAVQESSDSRIVTETKHEETRLTQQRHNEELLELLEKQQGTLMQNSKDLADYEKTLVQMAAELDQFRQVYLVSNDLSTIHRSV